MKKLEIGQIITSRDSYRVKDVYQQLCDDYGFKLDKIGHFGLQQRMFAKHCAPNGVDSTWIIIHSNIACDTGADYWVKNKFSNDEKTMEEHFNKLPDDIDINDASDTRYVFVRQPIWAQYKFLGIFKCEKIDSKNLTRIWKRV